MRIVAISLLLSGCAGSEPLLVTILGDDPDGEVEAALYDAADLLGETIAVVPLPYDRVPHVTVAITDGYPDEHFLGAALSGSCAKFAYIGSPLDGSDLAIVAAHELGHTFGLQHRGGTVMGQSLELEAYSVDDDQLDAVDAETDRMRRCHRRLYP